MGPAGRSTARTSALPSPPRMRTATVACASSERRGGLPGAMVADPVVVTTGEAITAKLSGRTPVRTLRGRNGTKADVHVYELPDGRVAVKDYGARGFLARH